MYSYITSELPKTVFSAFPQIDSSRVSISGHSMGGHGALSLFLKNPGMYKSCSAFVPITNPLKAPWDALVSFDIRLPILSGQINSSAASLFDGATMVRRRHPLTCCTYPTQ